MTAVTATYDAGITATLAAMFGASPGASPTVAETQGPGNIAAYTLDITPGCLPDVTAIAVSVDADLTGIAPGDVDGEDGAFIMIVDWDGVSPTPLDATPAVISGDDLAGLIPGMGIIGDWYTDYGGTVPSTSTPTVTGMVDAWRVGAPLATAVRAEWGEEGWQMIQSRPAPNDQMSTIVEFSKEV